MSTKLGLSSSIPPLKDAAEFMLVVNTILNVFDVEHLTYTPMIVLLYHLLSSKGYRWQLWLLSVTTVISSYINISPISVVRSNNIYLRFVYLILLFITLLVCFLFPMLPPIIPSSQPRALSSGSSSSSRYKVIGTQDMLLMNGENKEFWVRFYYPSHLQGKKAYLSSCLVFISFPLIFVYVSAMKYFNFTNNNILHLIINSHSLTTAMYDSQSIVSKNELFYVAIFILVRCWKSLTECWICNVHFSSYLPGGFPVIKGMAAYAELPSILFYHMKTMTSACVEDGPISITTDNVNIVLFYTGLGGTRTSYTSTCIDLAAQGNIVIVAEFTDGTPCYTVLPNGKSREYQYFIKHECEKHSSPREVAFRFNQLVQRSKETNTILSFLFTNDDNNIYSKSVTQSPFMDSLQLLRSGFINDTLHKKVFLAGHSFGAATIVHLALSRDSNAIAFRKIVGKIHGLIACDPWCFPIDFEKDIVPVDENSVDIPLMLMHASLFQWESNLVQEKSIVSKFNKVIHYRINDAGHYNYNEVGCLSPVITSKMRKSGVQDAVALQHDINGMFIHFVNELSVHPTTVACGHNSRGEEDNDDELKKSNLLYKSFRHLQTLKYCDILDARW